MIESCLIYLVYASCTCICLIYTYVLYACDVTYVVYMWLMAMTRNIHAEQAGIHPYHWYTLIQYIIEFARSTRTCYSPRARDTPLSGPTNVTRSRRRLPSSNHGVRRLIIRSGAHICAYPVNELIQYALYLRISTRYDIYNAVIHKTIMPTR